MKTYYRCYLALFSLIAFSCHQNTSKQTNSEISNTAADKTYADDRNFLSKHVSVIELTNDNAKILIVPKYQARVMTSTCQGDTGFSFGWINYDLISSGKYMPHINAYGGEERIWMGPEGGQYGLFFKKGDPFDIKHWQTPAIMDTVIFDFVKKGPYSVSFSKSFEIENYSGTKFHVKLERNIKLLGKIEQENILGINIPGVRWIGYQTTNTLKNIGDKDWDKSSGVLSVWLLSMMKAAPHATIIIPYKNGGANLVNDTYFGKVPSARLTKKDSVLFFKADAQYRSKIGIPPAIVKHFAGSYDPDKNILTIMQVDYKGDKDYVNSMWKQQSDPYKGDVVNAYNDGPNDVGARLGHFYEMETSSPAVALKVNQSLTHTKAIFHFAGDKAALNAIAIKLLGVQLNDL
jgi:hypothetical protein